MLSISFGTVVHDQPLKSLIGSTMFILFPTFTRFDSVVSTKKYFSFTILSFLLIFAIEYNNFLAIGSTIISLFSFFTINVLPFNNLLCSDVGFTIFIVLQSCLIMCINFSMYSSFVCASFLTVA